MPAFPHLTKKQLMTAFGAIAIAALIFIVLNGAFIAAHIRFLFSPPVVEQPTNTTSTPVVIIATTTPYTLRIPSLGVEAPVRSVSEKGEVAYQAALKTGVVRYPGTPEPGRPGNVYIFGHSSDYAWANSPYRAVFALLPNIKVGADILISDVDGVLYTYRVTKTRIINPDDFSALDQYNYERSMLTLQTSWPLGTALKRFIAIAELVE